MKRQSIFEVSSMPFACSLGHDFTKTYLLTVLFIEICMLNNESILWETNGTHLFYSSLFVFVSCSAVQNNVTEVYAFMDT